MIGVVRLGARCWFVEIGSSENVTRSTTRRFQHPKEK
jgi:hypothetical protein